MNSPLYFTGITPKGKGLVGGIFKMQDQQGFPMDASFEELKGKDLEIDWLEALCDCWLNDCLKFESFVRQAEILTGQKLEEMWKSTCCLILNSNLNLMSFENPINEACKLILSQKGNKNL